jgi:hypothetical protein
MDFNFAKSFAAPFFFGEKLKFEARGEVNNLFNRSNLTSIDSNMADANFGKETGSLSARGFQLHVRASF